MTKLNVSVATLNQIPGDFEGNKKNILKAIAEASQNKSALLVTPELSLTGYGAEDVFHSPMFIEEALIELHDLVLNIPADIIVTVGLPLNYNNRVYNAIAVVSSGNIHGFTFKQNLAGNGIHYEQRWFTPWNEDTTHEMEISGFGPDENKVVLVGTPIYSINNVKFGIEICEDGWVSDRVASTYFNSGVDIIINPSASHFAIGKFETRKNLVKESSRAYGVTYLYSNLNGCESGRAIYDGGSLIAVNGEIKNQGQRFHFTDVEVITSTVNTSMTKTSQFTNSQRHSDLRPNDKKSIIKINAANDVIQTPKTKESDFYDFLNAEIKNKESRPLDAWEMDLDNLHHEEAVRAVALGLRDWSAKTGTNGYVLSLSGGADSALVASLVYLSAILELSEFKSKKIPFSESYFSKYNKKTTFESDNLSVILEKIMGNYLTTGYQPSDNSGSVTRDAAYKLANHLGASHHVFEVGPIITEYERVISESLNVVLNWDDHDIPKQNIQARARSPMIWMVANLKNSLLLTTSNMSEASVGYVTQDGDSSGVLAPISGITKTRVLNILNWLEKTGVKLHGDDKIKISALDCINSQKPTAELRVDVQRDEDDLMPFPILDKILSLTMEFNLSPVQTHSELVSEFPTVEKSTLADYLIKYFRLFYRNQWKRDRQAPGFHIEVNSLDPKTYKRMPLLSSMYQGEIKYLKSISNNHFLD